MSIDNLRLTFILYDERWREDATGTETGRVRTGGVSGVGRTRNLFNLKDIEDRVLDPGRWDPGWETTRVPTGSRCDDEGSHSCYTGWKVPRPSQFVNGESKRMSTSVPELCPSSLRMVSVECFRRRL